MYWSSHESREDDVRIGGSTLASVKEAEAKKNFGDGDKNGDHDEHDDNPCLVYSKRISVNCSEYVEIETYETFGYPR